MGAIVKRVLVAAAALDDLVAAGDAAAAGLNGVCSFVSDISATHLGPPVLHITSPLPQGTGHVMLK